MPDNSAAEELKFLLLRQRDIYGDELFEKIQMPEISPRQLYEKSAETAVSPVKPDIFVSQRTESASVPVSNVFSGISSLADFESKICNCKKCDLAKGRNKFVFGSGNPEARVLLIGEGPGADEDKQGLPFVGRAGQLLTDILKAIKFSREEVYIANIVKCRPPGNRTPTAAEIDACFPFLQKQIELIKPSLILLLGATAVLGLLQKKESLSALRGKVYEYGEAKVMVTYHPAALLRNPALKRGCWEDVQAFRKIYDEMFPEKTSE